MKARSWDARVKFRVKKVKYSVRFKRAELEIELELNLKLTFKFDKVLFCCFVFFFFLNACIRFSL